LLSDLVIGLHDQMTPVYSAFLGITCLGFLMREKRTVARIATLTLASSLLFFLMTNFGVWAIGTLYPRTGEGLVSCFTLAIPFFRNQLFGDFLYSTVLFGLLHLIEKRLPSPLEQVP
jgi:hypothetical protein